MLSLSLSVQCNAECWNWASALPEMQIVLIISTQILPGPTEICWLFAEHGIIVYIKVTKPGCRLFDIKWSTKIAWAKLLSNWLSSYQVVQFSSWGFIPRTTMNHQWHFNFQKQTNNPTFVFQQWCSRQSLEVIRTGRRCREVSAYNCHAAFLSHFPNFSYICVKLEM